MHSDPQIPDWMERILSGRASHDEVLRLAKRPDVDPARLDEECRLNQLLDALPPVSVPSNLASRVLDAIYLEEQRTRREILRKAWWGRMTAWRPAWAAVALACLALGGWRIQQAHRTILAHNFLIVSQATALPGMDALDNFEAIEWLQSRPEPGDLELMAALATP